METSVCERTISPRKRTSSIDMSIEKVELVHGSFPNTCEWEQLTRMKESRERYKEGKKRRVNMKRIAATTK